MMNRIPLSLKKLFIIALVILPFFVNAQTIHSLAYYDSLKTKEEKTLMNLCKKARHSRRGFLALCVDSTNKPISGIKLSLDSTANLDNGEWKNISIASAVTDINGSCVFRHSNYNVAVSVFNAKKFGDSDYQMFNIQVGESSDGDIVIHRLSKKDIENHQVYRRLYAEHYASDISHLHDTNYRVKKMILFDSLTKTKFILDSTQTYITAIDSTGKKLWETDPRKKSNMMIYRIKHPIITSFYFSVNIWSNHREVIGIGYDNSQFGMIDKATGEFTFLGQD